MRVTIENTRPCADLPDALMIEGQYHGNLENFLMALENKGCKTISLQGAGIHIGSGEGFSVQIDEKGNFIFSRLKDEKDMRNWLESMNND